MILKKKICFIAIDFKICFRETHLEGSGKPEIKWYISLFVLC
jgi:hypothetical protein